MKGWIEGVSFYRKLKSLGVCHFKSGVCFWVKKFGRGGEEGGKRGEFLK